MAPPEIKPLTSLRFFAAASIVLFHMQGTILPMEPYPPLALGVSFFFVLSGFILTYSQRGGSVRQFYLSRFARIWPLHVVAFGLAAWLLSKPINSLPGLYNLLLLHAWVPLGAYVFSVNAVSWSLAAEAFFYALFPVLNSRQWAFWIGAFAITTGAVLLALDTGWLELRSHPMHLIYQNPLMRVLEFTVGIGFGKMFARRRFQFGTRGEAICVAAVLCFAVWSGHAEAMFRQWGLRHLGMWVSQSGGMLIFAAAIYVFAHQQGAISRALGSRVLVMLGHISFSTYMIHQIVIRYAVGHGWGGTMGTLLTAGLVLAIVYAGSYALWRVVEVEGRRLILRSFARPRLAHVKAG